MHTYILDLRFKCGVFFRNAVGMKLMVNMEIDRGQGGGREIGVIYAAYEMKHSHKVLFQAELRLLLTVGGRL